MGINKQKNVRIAMKVSAIGIVVNVILTIFKMIAGIVSNSSAMVSDAVHSFSDVASTVVVMLGIKAAAKEKDRKHQYGHERMESLAALILSFFLILTAIGIGIDGIDKIRIGMKGGLATPGILALIAALVSIVVKEWMYWYTRAAAKKIKSAALLADAWHHRSDSLSSIGSFIGIAGARIGFPILDPIASLVICALIFKVAIDIARNAANQMVDRSCSEEIEKEITQIALEQDGVRSVDSLRTRMFGSKFFVDIEIAVDGNLSIYEGHDIAELVHDEIEDHFSDAKHCMVHVNPYYEHEGDESTDNASNPPINNDDV